MANLDITLGNRDAVSGRFNFVWDDATGDVSFDDTQAHAVVTSVIEQKGTNPFDETHGSNLRKLRNLTSTTPAEASATALAALLSLEQVNAIVDVSATAKAGQSSIGGGQLGITTKWSTPNNPDQVNTKDV